MWTPIYHSDESTIMNTHHVTLCILLTTTLACLPQSSGGSGADEPIVILEDDASASSDMSASRRDAGGSGPTQGALPLEDFARAVHDVRCEVYFECGGSVAASSGVLHRYASLQECKDSFEENFFTRSRRTAQRSGQLTYDPLAASACIEDFKRIACEGDNSALVDTLYIDSCADTFSGNVATGEPCAHLDSCSGDDYCTVFTDGCASTCAPRVTSCDDVACGSDEYCDSISKSCKPRVALGQTCHQRGQCAQGFECSRVYGARCSGGECSYSPEPVIPGECVAPGSQGEGEPCVWGVWCQPGLTCSVDEVCTRPVQLGRGEPCRIRDTGRFCQPGLACQNDVLDTFEEQGTCEPPVPVGGTCSFGTTCAQGAYCDHERRSCVALKRDGEACASLAECRSVFCDPQTNTCASDYSCR